jgi:hypothetical protein
MGTDGGAVVTGTYTRHIIPRHLAYVPFKPQYDMKFDRIGLQFAGLNSCVDTWYYRIGLYSSSNNYPATLLNDFGALTVDPASPPVVGAIEHTGLDISLTGNTLYWIAIGTNQSAGTDTAAGRTPYMGMLLGDYVNMQNKGSASPATNLGGVAYLEQINSFGGSFPSTTTFANCAGPTNYAIRPSVRRSA